MIHKNEYFLYTNPFLSTMLLIRVAANDMQLLHTTNLANTTPDVWKVKMYNRFQTFCQNKSSYELHAEAPRIHMLNASYTILRRGWN